MIYLIILSTDYTTLIKLSTLRKPQYHRWGAPNVTVLDHSHDIAGWYAEIKPFHFSIVCLVMYTFYVIFLFRLSLQS